MVASLPVATLLNVAGLTVERGGRIVLKDFDLALAPGETILVAGRNGAGKSTLLRTLAGLLHSTAGAIRYGLASEDVRGAETAHYLGYEDALKPSLTVRENLEFWAAMLGGTSSPATRGRGTTRSVVEGAAADLALADRSSDVSGTSDARQPPPPPSAVPLPRFTGEDMSVQDALAAHGIARLADLPAGYLSAGQKRRVALARLLLAPRPIWLLDEPLIALDTVAQITVIALMAAHAAQGGAILLASHQPIAATRTLSLDA